MRLRGAVRLQTTRGGEGVKTGRMAELPSAAVGGESAICALSTPDGELWPDVDTAHPPLLRGSLSNSGEWGEL